MRNESNRASVPTTPPVPAAEQDRLNYLATLFEELEDLRGAVGLTPLLKAACQRILHNFGC